MYEAQYYSIILWTVYTDMKAYPRNKVEFLFTKFWHTSYLGFSFFFALLQSGYNSLTQAYIQQQIITLIEPI